MAPVGTSRAPGNSRIIGEQLIKLIIVFVTARPNPSPADHLIVIDETVEGHKDVIAFDHETVDHLDGIDAVPLGASGEHLLGNVRRFEFRAVDHFIAPSRSARPAIEGSRVSA